VKRHGKRREREIVQRDWVVADLISQFCKCLGIPRGVYLDIIYDEVRYSDIYDVIVKIGGWPSELLIEFALQECCDSSKATLWQVAGEMRIMSIHGPATWPKVNWFVERVVAEDKSVILHFDTSLKDGEYTFTRKTV